MKLLDALLGGNMKTARRVWLVVLLLIVAAYLGYRGYLAMGSSDGGPVFQVESDTLEISISDGEEVLLEGITATDGRDGDVTDSIMVEKLSDLYDENRCQVTYAAFDSEDNVTKTTRELVYTDYTEATFSLTRALRWHTGEAVDLTNLVQVTDCLDGDLTSQVRVRTGSTVSSQTAGIYQVVFTVTNSAGDTQTLETQLEVYDAQINEAEVELTDYLIYWDGTAPNYRNYLQSVTAGSVEYTFQEGSRRAEGSDGTTLLRSDIEITSQVNAGEAGVYPVYFTYEGEDYQGTTVLLVVVA